MHASGVPPADRYDSRRRLQEDAVSSHSTWRCVLFAAVMTAPGAARAAAANAAAAAPGVIDRVVLLGARASVPPEQLTVRKLYLVTRDDVGPVDRPRLAAIQQQFERAPEPKQLIVLDGTAHAQYVFETDQGERAMREILRFLAAP